jgi:hypothetical protein
MNEQKQIEKFIESVLKDRDLDWDVALVELNLATHAWDIEFEVPDGPEVLIAVPQGSADEMKQAIKQQIDEEIERVKAHKH